jgi:hypothetical protein
VALKLYYGGFGDFFEFTVAENEASAISQIGEKTNAPFLPITVVEITEVDGYRIVPTCTPASGYTAVVTEDTPEAKTETTIADVRHCKKCDFTCETQGQLLQHYREIHPKGD